MHTVLAWLLGELAGVAALAEINAIIQTGLLEDTGQCHSLLRVLLVVAQEPASSTSLGSLLKMQNLEPYIELLNKDLYFNKIHRRFPCMFKKI